ncbi:hypothetical protein, partial [Burkholderia latens]|uniref:hypothetical protein n=1 Tax=Burkholderia latens TaxID=488446 RepID=UPI001BAD1BE1
MTADARDDPTTREPAIARMTTGTDDPTRGERDDRDDREARGDRARHAAGAARAAPRDDPKRGLRRRI